MIRWRLFCPLFNQNFSSSSESVCVVRLSRGGGDVGTVLGGGTREFIFTPFIAPIEHLKEAVNYMDRIVDRWEIDRKHLLIDTDSETHLDSSAGFRLQDRQPLLLYRGNPLSST